MLELEFCFLLIEYVSATPPAYMNFETVNLSYHSIALSNEALVFL